MTSEQLLNITTCIGCAFLESGAETYRVEESLTKIFEAYGFNGSSAFAIPTCLIVTICTPDGKSSTRMKRITTRGTDLQLINYYNDLSRKICAQKPSADFIEEKINESKSIPTFNDTFQIISCGLLAFFFSLFFGGNICDGLCAILCGISIKIVKNFLERLDTNSFFVNIVASAISALIASILVIFGIGHNVDKIIIGALMNLVPGIAITNFMRDIMAGDSVAGITKLAESLLTATAIAIGAGASLSFMQYIMEVIS